MKRKPSGRRALPKQVEGRRRGEREPKLVVRLRRPKDQSPILMLQEIVLICETLTSEAVRLQKAGQADMAGKEPAAMGPITLLQEEHPECMERVEDLVGTLLAVSLADAFGHLEARLRPALKKLQDAFGPHPSVPPRIRVGDDGRPVITHVMFFDDKEDEHFQRVPEAIDVLKQVVHEFFESTPSIARHPPDGVLDCLEALRELGATSREKRKTLGEIASKVNPDLVNHGKLKKTMAKLARDRLVASMEGRSGGAWITPAGLELLHKHGR
jgi:hypothetical protein